MRILAGLLWSVLIVAVVAVCTYLFIPLWAPPLIKQIANSYEVSVDQIEVGYPSTSALHIKILAFQFQNLAVTATDLELNYRLRQLVNTHFTKLTIKTATAEIGPLASSPGPSPATSNLTSIAALGEFWQLVPADEIVVRRLTVYPPGPIDSLQGSLSFNSELVQGALVGLVPPVDDPVSMSLTLLRSGDALVRVQRSNKPEIFVNVTVFPQFQTAPSGQTVGKLGGLNFQAVAQLDTALLAELSAFVGQGTQAGELALELQGQVPLNAEGIDWFDLSTSGELEGFWESNSQPTDAVVVTGINTAATFSVTKNSAHIDLASNTVVDFYHGLTVDSFAGAERGTITTLKDWPLNILLTERDEFIINALPTRLLVKSGGPLSEESAEVSAPVSVEIEIASGAATIVASNPAQPTAQLSAGVVLTSVDTRAAGRVDLELAANRLAVTLPEGFELSLPSQASLTTLADARMFYDLSTGGYELPALELQVDLQDKALLNLLPRPSRVKLSEFQGEGNRLSMRFDVQTPARITTDHPEQAWQTPIHMLGKLQFDGQKISGHSQLTLGQSSWRLPLDFVYDLAPKPNLPQASVLIKSSHLITQPLLAQLIHTWVEPYDLTAGNLALDIQLTVNPLRARGKLSLRSGAVAYADLVMEDVEVLDLAFDYSDQSSLSVDSTTFSVGRLDVGVPIEQIQGELSFVDATVSVAEFSADLFGGSASIQSLRYNLAGNADFNVALEGLDLQSLMAVEGDSLKGTGTLDGWLPVAIVANEIRIVDGHLASRQPGGHIAYQKAQDLVAASGQVDLAFAVGALSNFEYSELASTVDYSPSGDLNLAIKLAGRNPEVEKGRPIHYNLNISENMPALLASLQVADGIESQFEKQK